jgi:hypothetical protein
MSGVNWPEVLAGFALGLVPLALQLALQTYRYITSGARAKYRGHFWLYYYDFNVTGVVAEREIALQPSLIRRGIQVRIDATASANYAYEGKLVRNQGRAIYLILAGRSHEDHVLLLFRDPLRSDFPMTTGILAGVSEKGTPLAARALLSRRCLEQGVAARYLGAETRVEDLGS